MSHRRHWLLFFLAVAALLLTNWWLDSTLEPKRPAAPGQAQRINYALSDFRARFHDGDGRLTLDISGPGLEHDGRTRKARITKPRFVIDPDGQAWTGRAERALIDRESSQLTLYDRVRIHRAHPRGTVRIASDEVRYDRPAGRIFSPGPAQMEQAGTALTGGTLVTWIDDEIMEFDQDVHAIYRVGAAASD